MATCPAHLHLASFIFSMMSLTLVLFLISEFLTLSRSVIFSILLSIACCAVLSFCSRYFVVVQVSQPYVIVGNTQCWSESGLVSPSPQGQSPSPSPSPSGQSPSPSGVSPSPLDQSPSPLDQSPSPSPSPSPVGQSPSPSLRVQQKSE